MPLTPDYGETPLAHDELTALLPEVIDVLDKPITRAAVYDLEQGLQDRVFDELMPSALDGSLPLDELLSDYFVRNLHTRMFGPVWNWAGRWRRLELNIGVAPEQIAVDLRNALDTIAYRWEHTNDWTPRQLGIVVHAETVRIHPFVDGNGRTTRLLADLVFAAVQNPTELQYDWELDKTRYIELLRAYDAQRDVADLAAFVNVEPIEP
ncbi:Fic/DOC family protein [Mycobacterium bohemicum DSM 44277]|uniref:Cell filamentation protein Fic n=2 Tax=Mycobacterium bohemicum TaxID=56425 RepID=A0A1X1QVW2_MYCBE|nr:Fic family protein [Mycobacterium bohemicum]MCV6969805.1 Fic family protein [Mycobacterium bohemicum]ORU95507.1 cell filamentation protein Fic [Mycobacterium bohemicum]CPR10899.1 Fic/DOC family protein [Mycobacterium bohemicum DSM 44277]